MKAVGWVALLLLCAACTDPPIFTATVVASATHTTTVGGRAQMVVTLTNTGPAIPHLGLVFVSADKWYVHHTVSDLGGCTIVEDSSAFDCGDLGAGQSVTFSFVGTAKDAGNFHYELALRELVQPFDYVNDHPTGADLQIWDESILPA
ncbi:MAG TPA: hypothetical protein VGU71_09075 [Candidatus Dormibacteraeota bacterium]|nr:hypothetical protein [Candidatus Dormibacteraeota bacterium]